MCGFPDAITVIKVARPRYAGLIQRMNENESVKRAIENISEETRKIGS